MIRNTCVFFLFVLQRTSATAVPPSFSTIPPPSVRAREGEPLHLRCRASGKPPPVITWRKDGWLVRNGENGIRLSGGELAVTSLTKEHAGKYTCKALNSQGEVEHATRVYIQGPPVIVKPPHNTTVNEGQEAMFACRAEAFPSDITYSWSYNGLPVSESITLRGRYSISPTGTLVIFNINIEDKGTVTCRADNGFGIAPTARANLTVQYPARVVDMPAFVYAGMGLQTTLKCPSKSEPPTTTVTWQRNGKEIIASNHGRYWVDDSGSLIIKQVKLNDAGRYTCTAFNTLGTMGESTGSNLIIRDPPFFTVVPDALYEATVGKSVKIPCSGNGDPPPHVHWEKLSEKYNEPPLSDGVGRVSWAGGNLTITSVTKADHGHWKCVLSNAVAEVGSEVLINVKYTSPHQVHNMSVVTSSTSAEVSWQAGFDGGYKQHFTIWYKEADKGDNMWERRSVSGNQNSAVVRNLKPDTIYQFSVLPENVLGSGQFSKTVSDQTKMLPTPKPSALPKELPSPTNLQYGLDGDTSLIVLTWDSPAQLDSEVKLLGYVIEYRMLLPDIELRKQNSTLNKRSRRSVDVLGRLFDSRKRRDVVNQPPFESNYRLRVINNDGDKWQEWKTLMALLPNETSYSPHTDQLYRDQVYQFQILAVSPSAYSKPSTSLTIDTSGLMVYGVMKTSGGLFSAGKNSPAVVAGVISGVVFVIVVVLLTIMWCYKSKLSGEIVSYNPSVDSEGSGKLLTSGHKNDETKLSKEKAKLSSKRKSFRKLKKKVLRVDAAKCGESFTNVTVDKYGHKLSSTTDEDNTPIRRISRAPDGKFHVSEESKSEESQALMSDNGRDEGCVYSPSRSTLYSSPSTQMNTRTDAMATDKTAQPPTALEIDCSQCDISVRYVNERNQLSPNKHPQLYHLSRRVTEPYMNSSPGRNSETDYGSYPSTSDYQRALAPYSRPISSTYVTVSPYAQYVHLRDINDKTNRPSERRISSPPEINYYNPTPVSPSKSRYHKHVDLPGGHYHVTPTASPAEPQFYAARHVPRNSKSNRHSAVVFRNGKPIYQIPPQTTSNNTPPDTSSTVAKQDCAEKEVIAGQCSTLPSKPRSVAMRRSHSHSSAECFRKSTDGYPSLEKSLSFHRANKSAQKIYPSGSNSLGRPQKPKPSQHKRVKSLSLASNEVDQVTSDRQRIRSVDDITSCHSDTNKAQEQNHFLDNAHMPQQQMDQHNNLHNTKSGIDLENQSGDSQETSVSTRHASEGASSSGYESHNTSHTSGSPISLSCQPSHLPHSNRFSTSSSSDRNRKETSSVDDKYEWDSELVMESEILEALRHYGSQKRTKPVSKALLTEIQKLGSTDQTEGEDLDVVDSSLDYSKESMDRRCAALKEEYMQYQKDLQLSNLVAK